MINKHTRDTETYESDLFLLPERGTAKTTPEEATQTYTALVRKSDGWWIGWILEVRGVICQGRTRRELLDTLKITLREILKDETLQVSRRTESEIEAIKVSDISEFGPQGASPQNESEFEEVRIEFF